MYQTEKHRTANATKWEQTMNDDVMCWFLHCTLMNIVDESLPQVLFAKHLYSPLWFLLMLVIFNSFPWMTSLVLTIFQKTVGEGVPVVTLHSFITCPSSSTVIFGTCSTAGGPWRNTFKWFVNTFLIFFIPISKT